MIPALNIEISDIEPDEPSVLSSLTYAVDFDHKSVSGVVDGIEALKQSVFCRLMTERGTLSFASLKYGLPKNELIGQSAPLVYVSLVNAITETLLEDDRILTVYGFIFDTDRKNVTVTFNIDSVFGTLLFEEVTI